MSTTRTTKKPAIGRMIWPARLSEDIPNQSSTRPVAPLTLADSTAETSIDNPSRTSTPRSRSRLLTALVGSNGWPNIARIPSRSAPSQPSPVTTSTTSEMAPVMVSALGVGGLDASMTPSGCAPSLTTPGRVVETECTTSWNSAGCPRSTKPKIANPRVSAGKTEKNAK